MPVALADANILISRTLRDYVVYTAKLGALDVHWSDTILDETSRNLVKKFAFTPADADILVERLNLYLPQALVRTDKRDHSRVADIDMDTKDRHALATALTVHADLLVTQNVNHFPREWMSERGVELIDAGTLLMRPASDFPDILREAHRLSVDSRPQTSDQVVTILARTTSEEAAAAVWEVVVAEPEAPPDPAE